MANTINVDKIKTIISYLAEKTDKLYITKLMKLFYYIDFISYAERNSSVTNDIYYKLPYGPIPSFIKSEIDNLVINPMDKSVESQFSDCIKLQEDKDKNGKTIIGFGKGYNLKNLSEYELDLINEIIKKIGDKTAKALTNKTHKEKPYLLTSENSVISYELANTLGGRDVLDD
jgi:uncharacterized phage-associated protein